MLDLDQYKGKVLYLAQAYTGSELHSFQEACRIKNELIKLGMTVFSPIAHNHHFAKRSPALKDYDWVAEDLRIVAAMDPTKVVMVFANSCFVEHTPILSDRVWASRGAEKEYCYAIGHGIECHALAEFGVVG